MSKKLALNGIMTQELYEWFGRENKKLLKEIDDPNLRESFLALEVVKLLNPELAREFENNPDARFARWVKNRGGELPRYQKREGLLAPRERKMEIVNLRWIGLAVLVVVVGGGLFHLIKKETKSEKLPPKPRKKPDIPTRKETVHSFVIAIAIDASKLEDQELTPESLAELTTQSVLYWVGSEDEWEEVQQTLALDTLHSSPSSEDALVLVSAQLRSTKPTPTTRVEISSLLRETSTADSAKWKVEETGRLNEVGFKRR